MANEYDGKVKTQNPNAITTMQKFVLYVEHKTENMEK